MHDERDGSTTIITERLLGRVDSGLTMDTILGALSVYHWWNDKWQEPEDNIEDLIRDAGPDRLPEFIDVLHQELPICENAESGEVCHKTGVACFADFLTFYELDPTQLDFEELLHHFNSWAAYLVDDDNPDDPNRTLRMAYERYIVDKLGASGATDIEIGNALEVLEIESVRRDYSLELYDLYVAFRQAGGSFEEYIDTVLVDQLVSDKLFKGLANEYEDLDVEISQLSEIEKRKLVRRYIQEHRGFYELLEVTFQKEVNGVLPYYLYRFTE